MNEAALAPATLPVLIVPVFEHGAEFQQLLPQLTISGLPVIVVDDGSSSETAHLLKQMSTSNPDLIVVSHAFNQGKGDAVMTGLKTAISRGFTHALQIDADGQHAPADIPLFLAASRENPDALIAGVPEFDESIPRGRKFGRYLTHVLVWIETLSLDIADSMCGLRVYPLSKTAPLLNTRLLGHRMDFDPEILVRMHWAGNTILNIPTKVIYPQEGHSNFRLFQDNVLITAMHFRLLAGMLIRLPKLIGRRWKRSNG